MRHSLILPASMMVFMIVLFTGGYSLAQPDVNGLVKHTFSNHPITMYADKNWNLQRKSRNGYELLFGCKGKEKCENIQIDFQKGGEGSVQSSMDYVIQEYPKEVREFTYVKSSKIIDSIEFQIADMRFNISGKYIGQTLVLAKIDRELVTIVFTGSKGSLADWAKYFPRQREQFMKVLETTKRVKRFPHFMVIGCTDSSSRILNWHGEEAYVLACGKKMKPLSISTTTFLFEIDMRRCQWRTDTKVDYIKDPLPAGKDSISAYLQVKAYMESYDVYKEEINVTPTFEMWPLRLNYSMVAWRVVDNTPPKRKKSELDQLAFATIEAGENYVTIGCQRLDTEPIGLPNKFIAQLMERLTFTDEGKWQELCMKK